MLISLGSYYHPSGPVPVPTWTPADLFAQGQRGVWYEPKPEYLFQDAEGTVPVESDGDPVGLMLDLSGNGNHATQGTSAHRPTYRTDGVLHWLQFDGTDDNMLLPVDLLNGASGLSAFAGARFDSIGPSERVLFRYSIASSAASTRFHLEAGRVNNKYNVAARRQDSDPFVPFHTNSTYSAGQDVVLGGLIDFDNATARIRVNGTPDGTSTSYLSPGTLADTDSAGARLGSAASGTSQFFPGRIYGILILPRHISTEQELTESYLSELAGAGV